jgi:hypothetical protein
VLSLRDENHSTIEVPRIKLGLMGVGMIREDSVEPAQRQYIRFSPIHRIAGVKHAILATVVSVEKNSLDLVIVRLQSEALEDAAEVISTGLNFERSRNRSGSLLEVMCKGDPRARLGDKVPVVIKSQKRNFCLVGQS